MATELQVVAAKESAEKPIAVLLQPLVSASPASEPTMVLQAPPFNPQPALRPTPTLHPPTPEKFKAPEPRAVELVLVDWVLAKTAPATAGVAAGTLPQQMALEPLLIRT